jgi:hypothetical protein
MLTTAFVAQPQKNFSKRRKESGAKRPAHQLIQNGDVVNCAPKCRTLAPRNAYSLPDARGDNSKFGKLVEYSGLERPNPSLVDLSKRMTRQAALDKIKKGGGLMPPFAGVLKEGEQ